jgi:hypothetical protein
VTYQIAGTILDFLPRRPPAITSVDAYVATLSEFHEAVYQIGQAWAECTGLKIEKNKTPPTKEGFPLSTIAYYIYGDGIGDSLETTPAQQGKLSH